MRPIEKKPFLDASISEGNSTVTFTETDRDGYKNRLIIDMTKFKIETEDDFKLYGRIYLNALIVSTRNDIARCDELLHFHDRHSVALSPKRMNLLERAYKSMGKLAFLALTFFALMAAKARFWP